LNEPLLLTDPDGLSDGVADELDRLNIDDALLLGGTATLSATIEDDLEDLDVDVHRVAGATRYENAIELAGWLDDQDAFGDSVDTVVVTTGEELNGGLIAGPVAARKQAPVLLTASDALPAVTREELDKFAATSVTIVGDETAISPDVEAQLAEPDTIDTVERLDGEGWADISITAAEQHDDPDPISDVTLIPSTGAVAGLSTAILDAPTLLTPTHVIPATTTNYLEDASPTTLTLLDQPHPFTALSGDEDGEIAGTVTRALDGDPIEGAEVTAEVLGHGRDKKIIVFKRKRRKGYRRKQGHRQGFTEVRVQDISLGRGPLDQ